MSAVVRVLLAGLVQIAALGALLFGPAGTLRYWQAWAFLAVFAAAAWLPSIYVQATRPAALARRMKGGPAAEGRGVQKIVMAGLYLSLASMCVVAGLDRRFGWSSVPRWACVAGLALVALGLAMIVVVTVQNHYASSTVQVEPGQRIVSSGLYGVVRHPMYSANSLLLVGLPLALGSYWALPFIVPGVVVLAVRIRDEEGLLVDELAGYRDYTRAVRHRLVPGVW